jgi:hypothetical protein
MSLQVPLGDMQRQEVEKTMKLREQARQLAEVRQV